MARPHGKKSAATVRADGSPMAFPFSRPLEAGEERRLIEAWRDQGVSLGAFKERFQASPADVDVLKAELGPKAREPADPSCFSGNYRWKAAKRKAARRKAKQKGAA